MGGRSWCSDSCRRVIVIACDGVGDLDALAHAGKEAVEGLEQEEALALEDLCEFGQMGGMSA